MIGILCNYSVGPQNRVGRWCVNDHELERSSRDVAASDELDVWTAAGWMQCRVELGIGPTNYEEFYAVPAGGVRQDAYRFDVLQQRKARVRLHDRKLVTP